MSPFYSLLEGLNNYLLQNNCWPNVKISPSFLEKNTDKVARLREDGIQIEVVESLRGKFCFVISRSPVKGINKRANDELKIYIGRMVSEIKEDEPILNMNMKYRLICTN